MTMSNHQIIGIVKCSCIFTPNCAISVDNVFHFYMEYHVTTLNTILKCQPAKTQYQYCFDKRHEPTLHGNSIHFYPFSAFLKYFLLFTEDPDI